MVPAAGPSRLELPRLASLVLLAGAVRQVPLARAAGRARLDLPVRRGVSLGDCWVGWLDELRSTLQRPELPMVVSANSIAGVPERVAGWRGVSVRSDSEEPRGSGGALRDIARDFDPSDRLLVAPGHSYPRETLGAVIAELGSSQADAVVHADAEGHPTGFFLLRCGALAGLPARGFVDLKEQALPSIAKTFDVRVVRTERPAPLAIRTLDGYVRALRLAAEGEIEGTSSLDEDWRCAFTLAEEGAAVHPGARLHDAVVLSGGRVERGAVVVRCLVGPGAVVKAGQSVFDELVTAKEPAR